MRYQKRGMAKREKLIQRMRNNPRDWRIEDLKTAMSPFGVTFRQDGTSHVVFEFPSGRAYVVPAHKPIKPVYVKSLLKLLAEEELLP
jgi:hypothetical protein